MSSGYCVTITQDTEGGREGKIARKTDPQKKEKEKEKKKKKKKKGKQRV